VDRERPRHHAIGTLFAHANQLPLLLHSSTLPSSHEFGDHSCSSHILVSLIGVPAVLRAMAAPAVVSWAAYLGRMDLEGTWLAFLGYAWPPYILSALAIAELISDQLPKTPSCKVPMQFGARVVT
jgi:hypothetical protein